MWQGQITCNGVLGWRTLHVQIRAIGSLHRGSQVDRADQCETTAGRAERSKPAGTQMMLSQAPALDTELQSTRSALLSFGPIFPCSGFIPLFWNEDVCVIPYWNYRASLFFFFILQEHIVTGVSRVSNKMLHIGPLNFVETIQIIGTLEAGLMVMNLRDMEVECHNFGVMCPLKPCV